ncbi:cellulase family glycosylhydrolase [Carboxylicivirga sp. M1479]|uniref:cellulase family glycosylhydrolase n=1 Tax=Carboxylicivirga sp. M1479 TaxID=2594476 RepID=UPI0011782047|nr:cellulase family glycosylhydrolase [Carboxylicivirga sp. M1479]TRX65711.1 cellulase family glycosylhydrolase [Carboxylicivirga sp. M1479]
MKYILSLIVIVLSISVTNAQTLTTDGKLIKDDQGQKVILRGIGTGNWVLMEGYMMKTAGVAGTQHEFRDKLTEAIGETATDEFFELWWNNHMTKADVDSMAKWGFNSLRLAMHYNQFTLPIEEESAEDLSSKNYTWHQSGFDRVDDVLSWCEANNMYLILDLHAAPGGQGRNADICDYDDSKPSLWEDVNNRHKTVALWRKLAERYKDEAWIGGYDLINETNWSELKDDSNQMLWSLLEECTDAIRATGDKHIVFLEGNDWANNYDGLPDPLWDDNLVISFHKYWNNVDDNSLDWIIEKSDKYNVPLWLGESGENSNVWYTHLIELCECKDIGWSWWPVKKNGINNIMYLEEPQAYKKLIDGWRTSGTSDDLTGQAAIDAVTEWANNHKIENVVVMHDVIDAMIRQPQTYETKPYKKHDVGDKTWFANYDLGRNGYAYWDTDTANLSQVTDYTDWNTGWAYRSDGVDIQHCSDKLQDGSFVEAPYNVGWTADNEWLQYTINNTTEQSYTLNIRHAGGAAKIRLMANGIDVTSSLELPSTANYETWTNTSYEGIILPAGQVKVVFYFEQGGANLNYFEFIDPQPISSVEFKAFSAESNKLGNQVYLTLNKEVSSVTGMLLSEFGLSDQTGAPVELNSLNVSSENAKVIELTTSKTFTYFDELLLSYSGSSVKSGSEALAHFSNLPISNNLPQRHAVAGKIEAEDFHVNNGFAFENTSDVGGGKNSSYAREGYYLDYLISVQNTAYYDLTMRVASENNAPKISMWLSKDGGETFESVANITLSSTGGWSTWQTQNAASLLLNKGEYQLRFKVEQQEHNLNWFEFKQVGESISDDPDEIYSAENFIISYVSPSCYQLADGSITIISKRAPINVFLNNGSAHPISQNIEYKISDLAAGEYDLLATSINNYDSYHQVILNEAEALYSKALVEGSQVSFVIEGGEAPYTINVNGQSHTSQTSTLTLKNLSKGNYSATIMDSNQCSEDAQLSFTIGAVELYPNPVNGGVLHIKCPISVEEQMYSLEIYSINGQRLSGHNQTTINSQITMNVSHLRSGMYFLKVAGKDFAESISFIVP